jgi:hypothetical protein
MWLPREQMPIKSAAEMTLTAEEKRQAATELRNKDIRGHEVNLATSEVTGRYAFSSYLVDPCRFSWSTAVRIVAIVPEEVESKSGWPEKFEASQGVGGHQEGGRSFLCDLGGYRSGRGC